jgi:arginine N-succinyltransferase
MGQINPAAEVPFDILTREGFEAENYIDIFDGGPTLHATTRAVRTVAQSRLAKVAAGQGGTTALLIATTRLDDFRVTVVDVDLAGDTVNLPSAAMVALGLRPGETVRIAPL